MNDLTPIETFRRRKVVDVVGTASNRAVSDDARRRLFLADLKTEILRLRHALVNLEFIGVAVDNGSFSVDTATDILIERGALDWWWQDDAPTE